MFVRRVWVMMVLTLTIGSVMPPLVESMSAASCTLTAPETVEIGSPITIAGSGFPASTSVDVSLTIEGGSPDTFSVVSDSGGTFQINLTPEASDEGITTVIATAGPGCTAQVVFAAGGSVAIPEPTQDAGDTGAAPRTDAAPGPGPWAPSARTTLWLLAFLTLAVGVAGLVVTRHGRRRNGRSLPGR